MENSLIIIIFAALLLLFIVYVLYSYYTSGIGKSEAPQLPSGDAKPWDAKPWDAKPWDAKPWYSIFQRPQKKECKKDITALKAILKEAVYAIKSNITFIKSENPLSLRPPILLTKYPFYIPIMKVPKYIENNPCLTKMDLTTALKELYGKNPEQSTMLHASFPGHNNYYIVLDLEEAYDYYKAYKLEGIDELI